MEKKAQSWNRFRIRLVAGKNRKAAAICRWHIDSR